MPKTDLSKLKLVMFVPSLEGGGAQRVMVHLANGMAARGASVDLVLVSAEGPYLRDVAKEVRLVDLRKRRAAAAALPLAYYLRRVKPNALISALGYANAVAILARKLSLLPVPTVTLVQSAFSQGVKASKALHNRLLNQAMKWAYRSASAVVADSHGTAEDLISVGGVPRSVVRVIYNPAIGPHTVELAAKPENHPFYAEGAPPVVLGVGSLSPVKDFATLIRAFARLRQGMPCRLMLLGEGPERGSLERTVRELGIGQDVSMPGFANNPYAHMARASLFALSSTWESMSLVVVEALSLGLPVVATNCDFGPREILQHGRYGRLVPVGDVDAMANAMRLALTEPKPVIPAEALRAFTLDAALDRYEELIGELTRM